MVYNIKDDNITINVNLKNGVHLLGTLSGNGKTRLYDLLQQLNYKGYPVLSYSDKDVIGFKAGKLDIPSGAKLYLFDEYENYMPIFNDKIIELSNDSIVLVSCKLPLRLDTKIYVCGLLMDEKDTIDIDG